MDILLNVVNYILGFGAAVFVPLIMFVLGLCVKMKPGDAFIAALTLGIAFTGMNTITSFMTGAIQPAAEGLADKTGLALTTVDTWLACNVRYCLGLAFRRSVLPASYRHQHHPVGDQHDQHS